MSKEKDGISSRKTGKIIFADQLKDQIYSDGERYTKSLRKGENSLGL